MRFEARLGSARVPMQVDIGFGDVVYPGIDAVSLRPVLDFASMPVPAYSRESLIAEKLHAMVKLGSINSRMNDFFDLWFLSITFDFSGETLRAAIAATFKTRGTAIPLEAACFTPSSPTAEKSKRSGCHSARRAGFRRRRRIFAK